MTTLGEKENDMKTQLTKENLKKGSLALSASGVVSALSTPTALAVEGIEEGANSAKGTDQKDDLVSQIKIITNTMLFAIGVVAVIMLIVGGFQYIFSAGDSKKVSTAKDTILYAIVGIVVALLAYAIVNFVLGQFSASQ